MNVKRRSLRVFAGASEYLLVAERLDATLAR